MTMETLENMIGDVSTIPNIVANEGELKYTVQGSLVGSGLQLENSKNQPN